MTLRVATSAVVLAFSLAPPAIAEKPTRASLSFYWIINESHYHGRTDTVLRDARGHVIARTCRKFRKALVLEGSGCLLDGRSIMYDCKVGGEHRFRVTKVKGGYTVKGCPLLPYRTAAVDPHFIKLGSTIYIPQLKGTRLPDGTVHDGIFIATDRGHFRGHHVDLFVGEGARGARPFIRRGYPSRSHVTVYVLKSGGNC